MTDYKLEAAKAAIEFIQAGQTIGLGAGTTISHLITEISLHADLKKSVTFTSSSFKTTNKLTEKGFQVQPPAFIKHLAVYFDGCDQFDPELNALKSGGGIHTTEKILASVADEFILVGDESKFASKLDNTYPIAIEILPQALQVVLHRLSSDYPDATFNVRISDKKDGAVITDNGNLLVDLHLVTIVSPDKLNISLKMIPGIVDHSLFYRMATKSIIAGAGGIRIIKPAY
ncbi:MAG: ribose 5-phosphate isomerase [Mucilaginibacter sp.]|nr:ribose 5-phosphate isomerase [Mucilaginibacter sp.]